jgi:hypothetical protein
VLIGLGTWIFYLVDASKHAPEEERTMWLVLLFLFSAVAAPAYWLRHYRNRGAPPSTELTLTPQEKAITLALTLVPSAWMLAMPFFFAALVASRDEPSGMLTSMLFLIATSIALLVGLPTWIGYLADVPRRVPAERRVSWWTALALVPPIAAPLYFRRFLAPPPVLPVIDQR